MYFYILLVSILAAGNVFALPTDVINSHYKESKQSPMKLKDDYNISKSNKHEIKKNVEQAKNRKNILKQDIRSTYSNEDVRKKYSKYKNKFRGPYDYSLKNAPANQYKKKK